MIDTEKIRKKIKKHTDQIKTIESKRDKLTGKYEAGMENLKEKYGVDSVDDAKVMLQEQYAAIEVAEKQLSDDMAEFEELYGGLLEAV